MSWRSAKFACKVRQETAGLIQWPGQQEGGFGHGADGAIAVERCKCYLRAGNHAGRKLAMTQTYTILGLESSCDDTAAAVVRGQVGNAADVMASVVWGQDGRFRFPRPLLDRPDMDMSFSGLKTALRRARDVLILEHGGLRVQDRADLCAGFQAAVTDTLAEKTRRACLAFGKPVERPVLAVAGGVAANGAARVALQDVANKTGFVPLCDLLHADKAFWQRNRLRLSRAGF